MLDFENLVARHSEFGVQDLIERIERNDGISARPGMSLEERWEAVMKVDVPSASQMVA